MSAPGYALNCVVIVIITPDWMSQGSVWLHSLLKVYNLKGRVVFKFRSDFSNVCSSVHLCLSIKGAHLTRQTFSGTQSPWSLLGPVTSAH